VVSEIVFEPSQQGTVDAESVELLEQQFMVNPVDGFNEVKIYSIDLHSLVQLFAYVTKDLK